MTLVPLPELLGDAARGAYAVGYFEAWDSYSLDAVVEAAEEERAPVILGFGCLLVDQGWLEAGGIETFAALGRAAAERARVPAALLLNEARSVEHALRGLDAGFNAAMVHGASTEDVARLVAEARAHGAAVEAELGELPTGDDAARASLTHPEEAAAYVAETGVDCLAVSVGNVHVLEGRTAEIDLDRLEAIHRAVSTPLAIHGGTSFPAKLVPDAIARGVAKFNVGTALKRAFLAGLASAGLEGDPHGLLGSRGSADVLSVGAKRMRGVVQELIRLYGASGRG
ncbi:MAG TPA: class II fructose-bisphosphate aldolase [Gaiellaceae bacterium]|nr:class II fructose-bisphosphate aldolase [Gaiellaceae bacterium]